MFNTGDKVLCIKSCIGPKFSIQYGEEYTVHSHQMYYGQQVLQFLETRGYWWTLEHFVLSTRAAHQSIGRSARAGAMVYGPPGPGKASIHSNPGDPTISYDEARELMGFAKECKCEKYSVFADGCKCGAIKPYQGV